MGWTRALAATLAGLTVALVAIAWSLAAWLGWSWQIVLESFMITNGVMALSFGICGGILAWHRPANPIGWLFGAGALLQAVTTAAPPVGGAMVSAAASEPLLRLLVTLFVYSWPWAIGLTIPLALLLFPDGRPVSPAWRVVVILVVVTAPSFALQMGASPGPMEEGLPSGYLTLASYDQLDVLWRAASLRTAGAYLAALVALGVRYRRGTEQVRRQLLWLLVALVVVVAANLVWTLVSGAPVAVLLAIPLIPVAVTVAVVRYRLLDIRLVTSRAVSWLLLSLGVLLAYVALVALLDQFAAAQLGRSATVTVLLVLVAAPLVPRLQRIVDRAMYGDRADPAQVVSRLGVQLTSASPGLTGVAASIRQALKLPYVGLLCDGRSPVLDGERPSRVEMLELSFDGEVVGELEVGLRPGERRLAESDRRVLSLVSAPLAAAVHATAVSAELQQSRERIVEAREEERRRLRRELHDGLGPTPTGIAFTADAAANHVSDTDRVTELLASLRSDARSALADVRRVVDDLRPPALDELGLAGALRQRAEQLTWRSGGGSVRVRVDVPSELPPLPAAVEVATYRIATEALTNIVRHSGAAVAEVRLRCGDALQLRITDDGPPDAPWRPGVGLQAMRERAVELGGTFDAGPTPDGGLVRASFPMGAR